jgi:hypothetical protein
LQLAPGDSILSFVAPKSKHTRSTPQIPLATPETDPNKLIKKGKASQEIFSIDVPGTFDSTFKTLVAISNPPIFPSTEVSISLDFENLPVEYSSFTPQVKAESLEDLVSPNIVKWFKLEILEDFPTLGFPTPPPIKVYATKKEETYSPLDPFRF